MTNGVVYQIGAKSIQKLQIKQACLLKKMAERHFTSNSLPRKRSFDTPEVPPPSRSPSRMNVICVRVRESPGNMEIDGSAGTRKDFQELLPGDKDEKIPTKIEIRVPFVKDKAGNITAHLKSSTDTVLRKPHEKKNSVLENQDNKFEGDMVEKKCLQTDRNAAKNVLPSRTEVFTEQLAPMVKGLNVLPNKIRRGISTKQMLGGRTAVYENVFKTENERTSTKTNNSCASKEKIKTIACDIKSEIDLKREMDLKGESDLKSDRTDSGSDIVRNQSNVDSTQEKVGRDRKKTRSARKKIGSARKSNRSRRGRKSTEKIAQENCGNDQINIKQDHSEPKIITDEKNVKEMNTKRNGQNSRETRRSYSKKIRKGRSATLLPTTPNVQGFCIFEKTLKTCTINGSKGETEKKTEESKKFLPLKPRATTRLSNCKSTTKLPRRSCSACSVKTSAKSVGSKEIESKSDTAASSKVQAALASQQEGKKVLSPKKKSQLPVSITLPSQMQQQNFDKVAKIKLYKTLAVKMRTHYYAGAWAFPLAQGREMKAAT